MILHHFYCSLFWDRESVAMDVDWLSPRPRCEADCPHHACRSAQDPFTSSGISARYRLLVGRTIQPLPRRCVLAQHRHSVITFDSVVVKCNRLARNAASVSGGWKARGGRVTAPMVARSTPKQNNGSTVRGWNPTCLKTTELASLLERRDSNDRTNTYD
jgi:hypothetical protein